ncbi:MAG TPA: hypothetical protein VHR45_03525 [Thermoanaerobaculia bacterium]|nr:hypothetical protein [Thermoanaerobaculia bacterium]
MPGRAQPLFRSLAAGLALVVLAAGCRDGGEGGPLRGRRESSAAPDFEREVAAARYTPPADGRLSDAQVRMYLDVQERAERMIRESMAGEGGHRPSGLPWRGSPVRGQGGPATRVEPANPTGSASRAEPPNPVEGASRSDRVAAGRSDGTRRPEAEGRPDTAARAATASRLEPENAAAGSEGAPADLRAARELRVNLKEYGWVRERVHETEALADTRDLLRKMVLGRDQLLARMAREKDALADPAQRAAAERELEDFKHGLQGTEPAATPAMRDNIALLARYRERFARLRAAERKAIISALARSGEVGGDGFPGGGAAGGGTEPGGAQEGDAAAAQ